MFSTEIFSSEENSIVADERREWKAGLIGGRSFLQNLIKGYESETKYFLYSTFLKHKKPPALCCTQV